MDSRAFLKIYIPALEQALDHDHVNDGFHVSGPDFYMESGNVNSTDDYINARSDENMDFIDRVGYYFDAKSHYFPNIQGVDIDVYRQNLLEDIKNLKVKYDL